MQQGIQTVDFSDIEALMKIYKSKRKHNPQPTEFSAFLKELHHQKFQRFIATYLIHCGVSAEPTTEMARELSHLLCSRKKKMVAILISAQITLD
jgi:hypothetical protein